MVSGKKNSLKSLVWQCIIRSVTVSLMTFILYASLTIIVTGMATEELGYNIIYTEDGENFTDVYTHYHTEDCFDDDGCDDEIIGEYKSNEYYKETIRSEVSDKNIKIVRWIGQALGMGILYILIYSVMWKAGDADANNAELGKTEKNMYKGLKAGLIADIPYALLYLILAITSAIGVLPLFPGIYKVLTYFMFGFNDTFIPVSGNSFVLTVGGISAAALVLLPIPLFAEFGYYMGEKHMIFKEKIVYKKEN